MRVSSIDANESFFVALQRTPSINRCPNFLPREEIRMTRSKFLLNAEGVAVIDVIEVSSLRHSEKPMKNSLQNFSPEGASSQATEEADTTVGTAYFLLCLFAVYFLQVEYVVFDPI